MSNTIIDPSKKPKHTFSGTVEAHIEGRPHFKSTEILEFIASTAENTTHLLVVMTHPSIPKIRARLIQLSFKKDISNGLHQFTEDGAILEFFYQENYTDGGNDRYIATHKDGGTLDIKFDYNAGTLHAAFNFPTTSIFDSGKLDISGKANVKDLQKVE